MEKRDMETFIDDVARARQLSETLKAVAHPLRLRIIALLCEGEEHVSGLAERLDARQPLVSQQLRILRMRGLVQAQTNNGHAIYRLAEPRLRELVRCVAGCRVN
jgi:ArsR family transcriptional regulator